jgi:hypothetical protein
MQKIMEIAECPLLASQCLIYENYFMWKKQWEGTQMFKIN